MEQVPEGLIGFDHVVEGIDGKVVVDDLLPVVVVLVGVLEVDVDDLFDLLAALLQLNKVVVNVLHHHPVKGVVLAGLERVLVHDGLSVLPDVLLDVLSRPMPTFTRMRISWSR